MDDRSYPRRVDSGSESIRLNWVGTMCVLVTRYRCTQASAVSESQLSMYTSVWPR